MKYIALMVKNISESDDHRIRVGRERSEKMRKRLLATVKSIYARHELYTAPVIDDIIKEAGVSRTTFYKHFISVDDAIDAVGRDLVSEMLSGLELVFDEFADPLHRMATGIQIFLLRSVTDAVWGAFVSRTDYLSRDPRFLKIVTGDLINSKKNDSIRFNDIEAAKSLFVGSMMEAIHHLMEPNLRRRAYVEEITVMILCGLGVEYENAKKIVRERAILIRGLAPDFLPWWQDPWIA